MFFCQRHSSKDRPVSVAVVGDVGKLQHVLIGWSCPVWAVKVLKVLQYLSSFQTY